MPAKRNKTGEKLEKKVTSFFRKNTDRKINYKQLAAALGMTATKEKEQLLTALEKLERKQILQRASRSQFQIAPSQRLSYEGVLSILPSGKGSVSGNGFEGEVLIPSKKLYKAFHGDRVLVSNLKNKKGNLEGTISSIVARNEKTFTGIFRRDKSFGFVQCRGTKMYTDFFIAKEDMKKYADGDKVAVRFKSWPYKAKAPYGIIEKTFGKPGNTHTEMESILNDYDLPLAFPTAVVKEAKKIRTSIEEKEIGNRRDFRKVLTFSIDPAEAKDFDDALSFEVKEEGLFEVGIHIADVSHYVTPNTALDEEAFERGTSVYLVDRVVPMLPEELSNMLCSLRPQEEKLTFSAVFHLNEKGDVVKEWFGRTVICSDHRFSYEEAQHLLQTQKPIISEEVSLTGKEYAIPKATLQALNTINELSKKLRDRRMKQGAISFEKVEVNFKLNEENQPVGVLFKESLETHHLIEEMMLLANRSVAEFVTKAIKKPLLPYRIHDAPDVQKLENLKQVVGNFGYSFDLNSKKLSNSINQLLSKCTHTKEQHLIDTLVLRCMSKAKYTSENIGHYGLAFAHYCHFTSPIRRYPDIMVHRLLAACLKKQPTKKQAVSVFEEDCEHLSQKEQLAMKAERDSVKFMQVLYMKNKIGKMFDGVISGVTDRGLYVELDENKCEGLIHVNTIQGDYFSFDVAQHKLVGNRTGKEYVLGDSIKIVVDKANVVKRYLDFRLVDS